MLEPTTDWLAQRAAAYPGRAALTDGSLHLTYQDLHHAALAVAAELVRAGVEAGDTVAIDLPPTIDHVVALHGAVLAGATVQSLTPGEPDAERAVALSGTDPVIVDDQLLTAARHRGSPPGEMPAIPERPRGLDDVISRVLSSGTSGNRTVVELTYANHLWSALSSALNLGVAGSDAWLCCVPLTHVSGLTIVIRSVIQGTGVLIHDRFDPERVAAVLRDEGASVVSVVPTQLARLIELGAPLKRARVLLVGGGPLSLDLLTEAYERGANPVQTYGLTEACSQVCTLAPSEARARPGSAGKPLLGTEVRIEAGEILVRGPTVAPASIAADGWLHTGDQGRIDSEGYLWVQGRKDDLIVTGGENVRPEEVEDQLRRHVDVVEAAVVGLPDPEWGEAVTAFVVIREGAVPDTGSLREHCRAALAPYKVPKRVEIVESLPRTASGKLIRSALR